MQRLNHGESHLRAIIKRKKLINVFAPDQTKPEQYPMINNCNGNGSFQCPYMVGIFSPLKMLPKILATLLVLYK